MTQPILQFGTGRFLQAHVDLFVSQALQSGEAIGGITVVQSTDSEESSTRLAALASGDGYRVEIRGRRRGKDIQETVHVDSVRETLNASREWPLLIEQMATHTRVVVSNTADQGYALHAGDTAALLNDDRTVPRSFPARLLVLLRHRWRQAPESPLSLFPCELVSHNGDVLRDVVLKLGRDWGAPQDFLCYVREHCIWANSLVDRIVSEPLHPVGAIAEPYALWAIERQDRMVLPCTHPAIVMTDSISRHERLKLMLLNLGHSFLAERWLLDRRDEQETVLQAMNDSAIRDELEAVWRDEVMPIFEADGEGEDANVYLEALRDRLLNPYLAHRLADIAKDHAEKKRRRLVPVIERAAILRLGIPQRRLRMALASNASLRSADSATSVTEKSS